MSEQGWSGVSAAAVGLLAEPVGAAVNDLILDMKHAAAGQSYLEWVRYRNAAELHTQLVAPEEMSDRRKLDALSRCATRIAITHSMPQSTAERLVDTAVALRDRLPKVSECLRDGLISPQQLKAIVERTDLVTDPTYQTMVDTDITAALRSNGSWSANRLRDMIDRIVFRADPAAVRRRRKAAIDARGFSDGAGRGRDGDGVGDPDRGEGDRPDPSGRRARSLCLPRRSPYQAGSQVRCALLPCDGRALGMLVRQRDLRR